MSTKQLSILVTQQGDKWAAQCLQYNIAAQGDSIDHALVRLQRTLVSEIAVCNVLGKDCFKDIPAAPDIYWKLYNESRTIEQRGLPPITTEAEIPPAFMLTDAPAVRLRA